MAISWSTFGTIPTLLNYAEAKKHHDDTKPIRGDAHGTRPCARRDQKWFSIWEAEGAIHVGYNNRHKLVSFHPSGTVMVHRQGSSAATNERLSKLLGENFQTHQYDTWVQCAYFDNGTHKRGWMPLSNKEPNMFVRHGGNDLIYLNYKFPITHTLNKVKVKEVLQPLMPFLSYIEGLAKLQERPCPHFNAETIAEVYGWADASYRRANPPPSLRWGSQVKENREEFFRLAASDNHEDRFKAAVTLSYHSYYNYTARDALMEQIMRGQSSEVLDKKEHRDGRLVKDRYRRFIG